MRRPRRKLLANSYLSQQGALQGKCIRRVAAPQVYRRGGWDASIAIDRLLHFNGPALHVLLIDGKSPDAGKDFALATTKNVHLGDLKGNQGDQEYRLPNNANLQELSTVSIYCMRFTPTSVPHPLRNSDPLSALCFKEPLTIEECTRHLETPFRYVKSQQFFRRSACAPRYCRR